MTNRQYNIYAPVSVLSPGAGSGSVTQSNSATNTAVAGNSNETSQGVEQAQAGSGHSRRGAQRQYAALYNGTSQSANAGVYNGQYNIYAPVYVNSPGAGSGNVSQSNSATNTAAAGNANFTDQAATQGQAAGGSGGGQDQAALVANGTSQSANARVYNSQLNIYAPVYVHSPGAGSGNVTQSNSATNTAAAGNLNGTSQDVGQAQAASGGSGRPAPDGTGPQRHVPGRQRDGLQRPGQHLRPGHRRRRRRWLGQPGELGEQRARRRST